MKKNQASLKLLYRQTKRLPGTSVAQKGQVHRHPSGLTILYNRAGAPGRQPYLPVLPQAAFLYPVFDEKILDAEGSPERKKNTVIRNSLAGTLGSCLTDIPAGC